MQRVQRGKKRQMEKMRRDEERMRAPPDSRACGDVRVEKKKKKEETETIHVV